MTDYTFEENEVPFDDLKKFGLTKEMITDLPQQVLTNFYAGRHTPVLPIVMTTGDGKEVRSRSRVLLVRNEYGNAEVMFFPVLAKSKGTAENNITADRVTIGTITNDEGHDVKVFLQLDAATGQIMSVPTPVIGHNLQVMADEFHLRPAEVMCIQHGEAMTVIDDDEEITMGIDLNSPTGVRMCIGDIQKWKELQKRDYNKYNFGFYGCWISDDSGNLDYVKEEDYTQELWDEIRKAGQRRTQMNMHK